MGFVHNRRFFKEIEYTCIGAGTTCFIHVMQKAANTSKWLAAIRFLALFSYFLM